MSFIKFRSSKVVLFAISLVFLFLFNSSYSLTFPRQEKTAADLKREAVELYHSGAYVQAIEKLKQIEGKTTDKYILAQAYIYLSMSYYCLEEKEEATKWLEKAVAANPEFSEADLLFPPGFENLYAKAKEGAATPAPAKTPAKASASVAKPPVVKPSAGAGVKNKGKSKLLLIAGGVVVAGVVAVVLLGGGPKTGSIEVSATNVTGAQVYLDGIDTGKTTNCTLLNVSPGSHTVKLVKDGYVDFTRTLTVTKGQVAPVVATLTPNMITVTQPAAGAVWIKGIATAEIRWQVGSTSVGMAQLGVTSQTGQLIPDQQRLLAQRLRGFRLPEGSGSRMAGRRTKDESLAAEQSDRMLDRTRSSATFQDRSNPSPVSNGTTAGPVASLAASSGLPVTDPLRLSQAAGTSAAAALLDIAAVKIELFKGSASAAVIVASTNNTGGPYSWAVPGTLADGADYKVRISCTSDASVYGDSGNFTINGASMSVTSPTGTTVWDNGGTGNIVWASNLPSENVKIELFNGATLQTTISASTPNDGSHSWTIPAYATVPQNTNYSIKITTLTSSISGQSSGGFIIAEQTCTYNTMWTGLNNPRGIAIRDWYIHIIGDSEDLAIAETGLNRLIYIDVGTGVITPSIVPFSGPRGVSKVRASLGGTGWGDYAVVADHNNNIVKRVHLDAVTHSLAITQPQDVVNDGTYLYIIYGDTNGRVTKRSHDFAGNYGDIALGGSPVGISCDIGRGRLYITDDSTNTVRIYNSTTMNPISGGWTLPGDPRGIAVDPDGFVYVAVNIPGSPSIQKYSNDGRLVFSTHWSSNYVPTGILMSGYTMFVSVQNTSAPASGSVQRYTW